MTEKKMTKKDYYGVLREVIEQTSPANKNDLLAFIDHEVELLNKKFTNRTETKAQKENAGIMGDIKIALAKIGKAVTVTELQEGCADMAKYSNQKLSALLKKLVDCGEVVKVVDKKKSYFSLAE